MPPYPVTANLLRGSAGLPSVEVAIMLNVVRKRPCTLCPMTLTDGSDPEIQHYFAQNRELQKQPADSIAYSPSTWARHLSDAIPAAIRALPGELAGSINRDDLQRFSTEATSDLSRRRLFLASLVWGLGKSNARMLPGLMRALEDPDLGQVLKTTAASIRAGHPGEAYELWTEASLPGMQEAFFTKWFYAIGLTGVPETHLRPFVLDGRVWKSLQLLGWSSEQDSGFRYRANPAAAYCAYLAALRRWATGASTGRKVITPDDIEHHLFRMNGKA